MQNLKVLIIGAGIGGIATAARLALHGYEVIVLEKNNQPGGRCGRLVKNGHHFDTGATLFLMPEIYAQTFADLGERIEDHLTLHRVDPSYNLYYPDGLRLALTSDLNAMRGQLEAIEPGSFESYLQYLKEGCLHYRQSLTHLVGRNYRSLIEFLTPKNIYLIFKLKALFKHYRYSGRFFRDDRLRAAFTFQNMYMGLSPFEAPAIYSLLQYTELVDGVWYPRGGMYSVVKALSGIAEDLGVQFIYQAPVGQINISDRVVTGVTLENGRQLQADIVIANADLPYVYRHLLPDRGPTQRLERKKYGCSAISFYWGVAKQYPQLRVHNLFFGGNYRQSFDAIFQDLCVADDPGFYVHAPVRRDPSLAPEGQDTLIVTIPVGHINEAAPQDWQAITDKTRRAVLQRLTDIGISDLEQHIKFEVSADPLSWQSQYNLIKGSCHGLNHQLTQMGYLRPHNRHRQYRNLYFVGASTHPGTGLPTVLISARHTAERIQEDAEVSRSLHQKATSSASLSRPSRL